MTGSKAPAAQPAPRLGGNRANGSSSEPLPGKPADAPHRDGLLRCLWRRLIGRQRARGSDCTLIVGYNAATVSTRGPPNYPMPAFADFLQRVLDEGEAVFVGPPTGAGDDDAARMVLSKAFVDHALDVAGPPISFDPAAALTAAHVLADACWRLVAPTDATAARAPVGEPRTPAAHLSADVTLRFLPMVYRRAAARAMDDPLGAELANILRRWPLSGVLADLPGGPDGELEFGGHPGLQLLYAERLNDHEKAAWLPKAGPARERVDLVYRGRGRPLPRPAVAVESPDE